MRSHWTDSARCEVAAAHIQMAAGTGEQAHPALPLHPTAPHAPRNVTASGKQTPETRQHVFPLPVSAGLGARSHPWAPELCAWCTRHPASLPLRVPSSREATAAFSRATSCRVGLRSRLPSGLVGNAGLCPCGRREEAGGAGSRSGVPRAAAGSTSRCGTSYRSLAFARIFSAQLVTTKV